MEIEQFYTIQSQKGLMKLVENTHLWEGQEDVVYEGMLKDMSAAAGDSLFSKLRLNTFTVDGD